ncbi:MAG: phosphohydrolase [Segetibacter sp.]|nr:phosphohydrolase [Segetibacter sp.]
MDVKILYTIIENYVTTLFEQINAPTLVFHNLAHTENVVKHTMQIARHYRLSENERFILFAAAWFHDIGHLFTEPHLHEAMSCDIMGKFLSNKVNNVNTISNIEECIMATRLPRNPKNLLQEIICDADMFHLGTDKFKEMNDLVRQEQQLKYGHIDIGKFNKDTVKLMEQHRFYTSYCKDYLNEKKQDNLKELQIKSMRYY